MFTIIKNFYFILSIINLLLISSISLGNENISSQLLSDANSLFDKEKYDESEKKYRQLISIYKKTYGEDNIESEEILYNLGLSLYNQEEYRESELVFSELLDLNNKHYSDNNINRGNILYNIAENLSEQMNYKDAQSFYDLALEIFINYYGKNHIATANILIQVGINKYNQNFYKDAEIIYKRSLSIYEDNYGENHINNADVIYNLSLALYDQFKFDEAEEIYKILVKMYNREYGINNRYTAEIFILLGNLYAEQSYYKPQKLIDAEHYLKLAIDILKRDYKNNINQLSIAYNDYGNILRDARKFSESEKSYLSAINIEIERGEKSDHFALLLHNYGLLIINSDRYNEENIIKGINKLKESIKIYLNNNNPNYIEIIDTYNVILTEIIKIKDVDQARDIIRKVEEILSLNKIKTYTIKYKRIIAEYFILKAELLWQDQQNFIETEKYYLKAINLYDTIPFLEYSKIYAIYNLYSLYSTLNKNKKANKLKNELVSLHNEFLSAYNHKDITRSSALFNLTLLMIDEERYGKAKIYLAESIDILRLNNKNDYNYELLNNLDTLANIEGLQGSFQKAIKIRLEIIEKIQKLNSQYFGLPNLYFNLGTDYFFTNNNNKESLYYIKKAISNGYGYNDNLLLGRALSYQGVLEFRLKKYKQALLTITRSYKTITASLNTNNFNQTNLNTKLADHFWDSITDYIYISYLIEPNDKTLLDLSYQGVQVALNSPLTETYSKMAGKLSKKNKRTENLFQLKEKLENKLINYEDVFIKTIFKNLENKINQDLYLDEQQSVREELKQVNKKIKLDSPKIYNLLTGNPLSISETQKLLKPGEAIITFAETWWEKGHELLNIFLIKKKSYKIYSINLNEDELSSLVKSLRAGVDYTKSNNMNNLPIYNLDDAYNLYKKLFPNINDLRDITHLFVVPSFPLQSIPFGMLVTKPPKHDISLNKVDWLIKKFPITRLPSVASLSLLRSFTDDSKAPKPFIGFGNPNFYGSADSLRKINFTTLHDGQYGVGSEINKLPSLPDTEEEVRTIAKYLKAEDSSIFLGDRANEENVKRFLPEAKNILFATHGLISGEIVGLNEPALVLSPPDNPSNDNDGLLTSSEITEYNIDADWVILSACNTAVGETNGALGVSGLAQAFIFAGARSLLVSHWSVESSSATKLTTRMFHYLSLNENINKSEALRYSIIDLINDTKNNNYAHPLFWAPFSLIGE